MLCADSRSCGEKAVVGKAASCINSVSDEGGRALLADGVKEGGLAIEELAPGPTGTEGDVRGEVDICGHDVARARRAKSSGIEGRSDEKEGEGGIAESGDVRGDGIDGGAAFEGTVGVPERGQKVRNRERLVIIDKVAGRRRRGEGTVVP